MFATNAILHVTNAISHAISHATNAISYATNLTLKKHIKKKFFICANTKIDVTNATNCSAGKGAISPPHQTLGNRGSIMYIRKVRS